RPRLRRDRRMAAAMKRRSAPEPAPARPASPPAAPAMALLPVLVAAQLAQHLVEVLGLAEIAVDRGEAHIGDVVDRLQRLHDEAADLVRHHLGLAGAFELAGDAGGGALDALGIDIAFP